MPFYNELSHFLTKDKPVKTPHTYGTMRGRRSNWQEPHWRRRLREVQR